MNNPNAPPEHLNLGFDWQNKITNIHRIGEISTQEFAFFTHQKISLLEATKDGERIIILEVKEDRPGEQNDRSYTILSREMVAAMQHALDAAEQTE